MNRHALTIASLPYALGHSHAADTEDAVTLKRVAALLLEHAQAADGIAIEKHLIVEEHATKCFL